MARWTAGLFVHLRERVRQRRPEAAVRVDGGRGHGGYWLSLAEAELFLGDLTRAVAAARAEAVREREAAKTKGAQGRASG